MDIQKIISDIVSKIGGDKNLIGKFTANPVSLIRELTGLEIDAAQIQEIIKGVTSSLGIDAADVLKDGKGLLDKVKGIFGK